MNTTPSQPHSARPPQPRARKSTAKQERLVVRVSAEQKQLLERAAALFDQPLSQFVISSALRAAKQAIRDHEVITLSLRDSQLFAALVLNAPAPNERLRAAMERQNDEVVNMADL